jgi:hypothetical protein
MIKKTYPVEEINTGIDSPIKEKKQESEDPKEERGSPDGEDEAFPVVASRAEVFDALEEAYRKDRNLQKKLIHYAGKQIFKWFEKYAIGVITSADVVQIVIKKLIDGDRKWNRERIPNIIHLVLMAIISFVRNESKKYQNPNYKENTDHVVQYDENEDLTKLNLSEITKLYLDEDLNNESFSAKAERIFTKCKEKLENDNDTDAYFVMEEFEKDNFSNIQIAANLKINVKEVENAKKRIRRSIKKFV